MAQPSSAHQSNMPGAREICALNPSQSLAIRSAILSNIDIFMVEVIQIERFLMAKVNR